MQRETQPQTSELLPVVTRLANVFFQRRDLYARQIEDGSYICVREPLTETLVRDHVRGKLTLGTYVLDAESRARFIAFDADDEATFDTLVAAAAGLQSERSPVYLERSRRGGHLWLFLPDAMPGAEARAFSRGIIAHFGLPPLELFPKQDQLSNGPGSLIRLPFGVHRKSGQRYPFVTPGGEPIAATLAYQMQLLSEPLRVPQPVFARFRDMASEPTKTPVFNPVDAPSGTLSQRIKASVTVYDFVSQYVTLGSNGRGKCPFHDDNHASFSVNREQNYWHCFAGCGGGSVIDFWMKRQGIGFADAVRELANMVLV